MSRGTIVTLVIVGVLVVFGIGFVLWGAGIKDKAVDRQEAVDQAWSDVQAAYQRRADLVPNLVATVKEAAENERGILTAVTQARAGITEATTPEQLEAAGRKINTAINLAFEAYPQIRSTENFAELQSQLEGTENRINVARQRYNEAVRQFNSFVRGFWRTFALNFFGGGEDFSVRKGFQASEGAENAPNVRDELRK